VKIASRVIIHKAIFIAIYLACKTTKLGATILAYLPKTGMGISKTWG